MQEKLLRYEELILEIKKLELEKDKLGAEIKQEMIVNNATKTEQLRNGYILLKSRKKYTYTPNIDYLEDGLKKAKKLEELNGEAELSETQYLQYSNA